MGVTTKCYGSFSPAEVKIKPSWRWLWLSMKVWFPDASYRLACLLKGFLFSHHQNVKSLLTLQKSNTAPAFSLFCWNPNIIFPFSNLFSSQCNQLLPERERLDLSKFAAGLRNNWSLGGNDLHAYSFCWFSVFIKSQFHVSGPIAEVLQSALLSHSPASLGVHG